MLNKYRRMAYVCQRNSYKTVLVSCKLAENVIVMSWYARADILTEISVNNSWLSGERGGSVVECRTPEREVRGSRPTAAVLCPWARHFTPRKYWLITQEAMAPSRYDWKIVDWDVKPQYNQPNHGYPLRFVASSTHHISPHIASNVVTVWQGL